MKNKEDKFHYNFDANAVIKKIFLSDKKKVIAGADCTGFFLPGENLKGKNLKNINFGQSDLRNANFEKANLEGANFQYANLNGTNLKFTNLKFAKFDNASFISSTLIGADLSNTVINNNNFTRAKLIGVDFQKVQILNANFKKANFEGAKLIGVNLLYSKIDGANFQNANIQNSIISEQQIKFFPKEIILKFKDSITVPSPLSGIDNNKEVLIRSIEFPPEYKQAGMSILNYFSEILYQKYPEEKVKIKIEQEHLKITMIIETEDGHKEKIERELEKYGLVVSGKISADQYCKNPLEALALKQKLEMAVIEVKHTRELMHTERSQYEARISSLEELVHFMLNSKTQDININISNVGSPTITDNSSRNVSSISNKTELRERDKLQIYELIEKLEKNLPELYFDQANEKSLKEFIASMRINLKKEKPDFFGLKNNLNSINNILQGATGSLLASGLLPQIQSIISNIFN